jgi:hypothetical protein
MSQQNEPNRIELGVWWAQTKYWQLYQIFAYQC